MPQSLATKESASILKFQEQIGKDLILKPLNQKAGEGIFFLAKRGQNKSKILGRATCHNTQTILAQEFIKSGWTFFAVEEPVVE